jgi:hypothetical protein
LDSRWSLLFSSFESGTTRALHSLSDATEGDKDQYQSRQTRPDQVGNDRVGTTGDLGTIRRIHTDLLHGLDILIRNVIMKIDIQKLLLTRRVKTERTLMQTIDQCSIPLTDARIKRQDLSDNSQVHAGGDTALTSCNLSI